MQRYWGTCSTYKVSSREDHLARRVESVYSYLPQCYNGRPESQCSTVIVKQNGPKMGIYQHTLKTKIMCVCVCVCVHVCACGWSVCVGGLCVWLCMFGTFSKINSECVCPGSFGLRRDMAYLG